MNTEFDVSTMVEIVFLVFDNAVPANNATVTRTVTISNPCPSGEYYCTDVHLCSAVDCETRASLLGSETADVTPPVFTLVVDPSTRANIIDARTVYITYRQSEDMSLLPCPSYESTADCWCVHHDAHLIET